jgi:hypothetical protein
VTLTAAKSKDGAEGVLWAVDRPGYIAKVYRKVPSSHRVERLRYQRGHPIEPHRPAKTMSFAWPTDLLRTQGSVVGFLMQESPSSLCLADIETTSNRKWNSLKLGYKTIHIVSANIASVFFQAERYGARFADVNPRNFLIRLDASVLAIDTDSLQIADLGRQRLFTSGAYYAECLPPELVGLDLNVVPRTSASDRFCLAWLVYRALFGGAHPFRGIWSGPGKQPDDLQLIRDGHYVHSAQSLAKPSNNLIPMAVHSQDIQDLFRRAFMEGYRDPERRPGADEWRGVLAATAKELVECTAYPDEHQYHRSNSSCPWCDLLAKGCDYFAVKTSTPKRRTRRNATTSPPGLNAHGATVRKVQVIVAGGPPKRGMPSSLRITIVSVFIVTLGLVLFLFLPGTVGRTAGRASEWRRSIKDDAVSTVSVNTGRWTVEVWTSRPAVVSKWFGQITVVHRVPGYRGPRLYECVEVDERGKIKVLSKSPYAQTSGTSDGRFIVRHLEDGLDGMNVCTIYRVTLNSKSIE